MPEPTRISLDNPVFRGRLRQPQPLTQRPKQPGFVKRANISDYTVRAPGTSGPRLAVRTNPPIATPAFKQSVRHHLAETPSSGRPLLTKKYSKLQLALFGMASLVFMVGLAVSIQTAQTNHNAASQVSALSKRAASDSGSNSGAPSTTKPSAQAISQYTVAPDLPRYIKIPKLKVYARVMQVGVDSSNTLQAPSNIFDTAWYTGSAKPGQNGATLIDGHVSSWTTRGVFYNLKSLVAGDTIQITRGDGAVLNYRVAKTQVYNANNVDMRAAIAPVTVGKSGLNLITCTGQLQKNSSQFSQRLIVFAEQV